MTTTRFRDGPVGLGGQARHQAWTSRPETEEEGGHKLEALDPFGAQVAAIQATWVEAQPHQMVLFPDIKSVAIPPHKTWKDSRRNYVGIRGRQEPS